MSLQRVPIKDYRGGLNTRDGAQDLQANESPDLLNVTISSLVGSLESRKGKTRVDTVGMPNATVDYAKQVVIGSAGARFLMLSINGAVYAMEPDGKVKKVHTGTAGTIWDFEVYADAAYKDWVYMGNGVDAMLKWDGIAAEAIAWPATKGTIPKGGVLCVWENRMFITYEGTHSQRLYFSEFADPEATIAEYGFVDIRGSEEDLDSIQDLAVLGARLIVLKRRGVFFVSNPTAGPSGMNNRHIGGPGVWGRFQTAVLEDKVYFFNPQGLFSTGGVQVSMESGSINNYFPKELNKTKLENVRIMATKDTYPRLLLAVTTGVNTTNDKLIEMVPHINFRRIGGRRYLLLPAFMLHTLKATALAAWNPTGTEELMIGCDKASSIVPFPALAITDTFNRANENPLSNAAKWTSWEFADATAVDALKLLNKQAQARSNAGFGDAIWTAANIKEPQAMVRVSQVLGPIPSLGESQGIGLLACVTGATKNWNGYYLTWNHNNVGIITNSLTLVKVEAGLATFPYLANISGVKAPEAGDELGMTVAGGKIYIGIKPSGGAWETIAVVEESTFKEGKCGIIVNANSFPASEGYGVNNYTQGAWVNSAAETAAAFELFNGTTDDGTPIIAHWTSSWIAVQAEEPKERIRRLNIELSGDAEVEVFKDYSEVASFTKALPKAEGAEPNKYRFVKVRPETHGRFHQVRVKSVAAGTPFVINAMELAVRGGKEH